MDGNVLIIGVIILIVVIWLGLSYVLRAGANKAEDAIKNTMAKKKAQENPPQQVSRADRYGQAPAASSAIACPQCGNNLPAGTKFCNKCGATLDNGQ